MVGKLEFDIMTLPMDITNMPATITEMYSCGYKLEMVSRIVGDPTGFILSFIRPIDKQVDNDS